MWCGSSAVSRILDPAHRVSERVAEKAGFARVGVFA